MAKQTFTTGQVLTAAQMTSLQQTAMGGGSTTAKTTSYVLVAADAGTVVQMNSASATTITVNTALFAAGDTVQIQNVGAGVCTVTAGTATVSTSSTLALKQYDAGSLYFNSTSAAIFFAVDAADGMTNPFTTTGDTVYASGGTTPTRLGIGSTGQVLTVASGIPSWATPAGGSSLNYTLLNAGGTALTGATAITISGITSKALNIYVAQGGSVNASTEVTLKPNNENNASLIYYSLTNTTPGAPSSTANCYLAITGNNSLNEMDAQINITSCDTAGRKPLISFGAGNGTNNVSYQVNGTYNGNAITSIVLNSSSGNFDEGTIYVYGGS